MITVTRQELQRLAREEDFFHSTLSHNKTIPRDGSRPNEHQENQTEEHSTLFYGIQASCWRDSPRDSTFQIYSGSKESLLEGIKALCKMKKLKVSDPPKELQPFSLKDILLEKVGEYKQGNEAGEVSDWEIGNIVPGLLFLSEDPKKNSSDLIDFMCEGLQKVKGYFIEDNWRVSDRRGVRNIAGIKKEPMEDMNHLNEKMRSAAHLDSEPLDYLCRELFSYLFCPTQEELKDSMSTLFVLGEQNPGYVPYEHIESVAHFLYTQTYSPAIIVRVDPGGLLKKASFSYECIPKFVPLSDEAPMTPGIYRIFHKIQPRGSSTWVKGCIVRSYHKETFSGYTHPHCMKDRVCLGSGQVLMEDAAKTVNLFQMSQIAQEFFNSANYGDSQPMTVRNSWSRYPGTLEPLSVPSLKCAVTNVPLSPLCMKYTKKGWVHPSVDLPEKKLPSSVPSVRDRASRISAIPSSEEAYISEDLISSLEYILNKETSNDHQEPPSESQEENSRYSLEELYLSLLRVNSGSIPVEEWGPAEVRTLAEGTNLEFPGSHILLRRRDTGNYLIFTNTGIGVEGSGPSEPRIPELLWSWFRSQYIEWRSGTGNPSRVQYQGVTAVPINQWFETTRINYTTGS